MTEVSHRSVDKGQQGKPNRGQGMGISPIVGILPLSVARTPQPDSDVSRVFDIVNSAKPGDDRYSGNAKNAAGGEDDSDDDLDQVIDAEPSSQPADVQPATQVSFFA